MNTKTKVVVGFVAGLISGAAILFATMLWHSNSKAYDPLAGDVLDECKRVTDITNLNDESYRALKISDCMGANGFTFIGTGPGSICFAESPVHVQIKHIIPGCYIRQSTLPKLSWH